jgi:hypothetical protein
MKQHRKCCETAMIKYYETAPIIIILWKSILSPNQGLWIRPLCVFFRSGGRGGGGQCKQISHYRSSWLHIFLKILLQVNKKHSKNALIYIPISLLDSPLHGASFELTYLYHLFCLGPENYITMLRTPKILYKCSEQYGCSIHYRTISTSVPFRPMIVQVSN